MLELEVILKNLEQPESEENWDTLESNLLKLEQLLPKIPPSLLIKELLKPKMKQSLIKILQTERTRLVKQMLSLISAISFYLKHEFQQLLNIYLPTVLKLTTRANKVYISLSTNTLKTCVENSCLPAIITTLVETLKNSPSKSQRISCQELLCFTLMKNDRLAILPLVHSVEEGLSVGILDSCSQVRDKCRNLFDLYKSMFRERVEAFVKASTPVAQKYFKVTRFESQRENCIEKKYGTERDVVERNLFVKFARTSNQLATSTDGDSKVSKNSEQDIVDLGKSHDTPRNILLAQRVPKVVKSATKRFLQPAQRIIQVEVESMVEMKSDSSVAGKPVTTSKVKSPKAPSPRKNLDFTLNDSSKIPLTKSKASFSSANIIALESGLKDSNWSKRVDSVKRITEYLNPAQTIDYSNPNTAKLYALIVKGLSDAHFKVILTALETLMSIINPSIPQQHLGTLLVPVLSLATSGQKQKPSIVQSSHSVLQLILKKCDPGSLAFALNQSLQNVNSFPRVKLGVLNYISTFQPNHVKSIFKNKTTAKQISHKINQLLGDQDETVAKLAKETLRIFHQGPESTSNPVSQMQSPNLGHSQKLDSPELCRSEILDPNMGETPVRKSTGSVNQLIVTPRLPATKDGLEEEELQDLKGAAIPPMFPASTGDKSPARTMGIDECQSQSALLNSGNGLILQSNSKRPVSLIPLPKSVTNSPVGVQIMNNAANHVTTSPFNNSTWSGNSLDPQDSNQVCQIREAIVKSSCIHSLIVEHRNLMGLQSYMSEEAPKTLASYGSEFETAESNMRDLLENFRSLIRINEAKDSDSFFTPSESLTDSETNHSAHHSSNVSAQEFQSAKSDSGVENVLAEIEPPVNQTVVDSVHNDAVLINPAEFECVIVEEIHIPIIPLFKSDSEVTISIDADNEEQIEFSGGKFERKLDSSRVVANDELDNETDSLATLSSHIYSIVQKMNEPSSIEINKILNLVLHEMNHLSITDRGHLLLKSLKDLKENRDSLKLVDLLLNHCDNEEGFQTCSDTLQYLVKLNASISADTEAKLFQILFKGIMSRQSSVRRSAFEISYHLVQLNDLAWEINFYAEIREFAGTLKENMMRNMVSQRRLMH